MKNINEQLSIESWKFENQLNFQRSENITKELYWQVRSQLRLRPDLQLWLQLSSQLREQLKNI